MRTATDRNGYSATPTSESDPGGGQSAAGRISAVVDALVRRAAERDREAEERDARARAVTEELAADPSSHTAEEVAALAVADRAAAAADRLSAAEDRETLLRIVTGEPAADSTEPPPGLTGREAQVLERLARAMTTRAIAEDLYLSPNSVKTHTQSVFRKIGVKSRSEAALWARDHGIG